VADLLCKCENVLRDDDPESGLLLFRREKFDGLDRLTVAKGVTYTYDSLDRVRTRKQGTAAATAFAYGGKESDPVTDGVSKYSRSPGGMLLGQTKAAVFSLMGLDRHGDVSWTLNPATGAIVDSVLSDPFGKTLGTTGVKPGVGFQGDCSDPTSGLVWMAARWCNPVTGTFVSRDTYAGEVGAYATINRYTYGLNDPLRFWDPTGRFSDSAVWEALNNFWSGSVTKAASTLVADGTGSFGDPDSFAGMVQSYTVLGSDLQSDSLALADQAIGVAVDRHFAGQAGFGDEYAPAPTKQVDVVSRNVSFSVEYVAGRSLAYMELAQAAAEDRGRPVAPTSARGANWTNITVFQNGAGSGTVNRFVSDLVCSAGTPEQCRANKEDLKGEFVAAVSLASLRFPMIGTGIASHEVVTGRDMFGEKVSGTRRAVNLGLVEAGFGLSRYLGRSGRTLKTKVNNAKQGIAGSGGRIFQSPEPYTAEPANAIEKTFPGRIVGVNENVQFVTGKGFREVDINLGDIIIQVKSGTQSGSVTAQVVKTRATTGKIVIGYAPDITEMAWGNAARNGIPIARSIDELIVAIRHFGSSK
jgi:RHS repeat-associated protein